MNDDALKRFLATLTPAQRDQFLQDAIREAQRQAQSDGKAQYRTPDGIIRFVREIIGADPAPYQEHILRALVEYKRVAVRSPHGAGKTTLAAWVVLWGMYCFPDDVKIPTTASAWRQLEKFLWPEIKKWARKVKWDGEYPRILDLSLKMTDKEAFAVASDTPELIEGAHARTLIFVYDEAKAIMDGTWDAAEGAFSGAGADTEAEAYALAISTPGEPSGRFYDIHTRRPGLQDWYPIHVTLEEAIEAGRISREWAEQRRAQWGENSAVYQNRVLGNFDTSGEDNVIPLAWVEAASDRWETCGGHGEGVISYGVDPARYGTDKTAIARLVGRVLERIEYSAQEDTMQTAGRVAARVDRDTPVAVDVIGIGAGVFDRLKEQGYNVNAVNAGEAARLPDGKPMTDASGELNFLNVRSALWWLMREALDPTNPDALALPPDDTLTGDLTAPKYGYTSRGQIQVESKDDIRKRIGRSTDAADALALALYNVTFAPTKGFSRTHVTNWVRPVFGAHRRNPDQPNRALRSRSNPDSLTALARPRRMPTR